MSKLPLTVTNFITPPSTEISKFLAADTQLMICNGANPAYKLGTLMKDLGFSLLNATNPAHTIVGLADFRQSASVQSELAMVYNQASGNTELWHRTTGTWTKLTTPAGGWATQNDFMAAVTFLGSEIVSGFSTISGNFIPPVSVVEGNSPPVSTQLNVAGMPRCKYLVTYRDRVYALNCYINDFYEKTGVATSNGSPLLTSLNNTDFLYPGQVVNGTGIPAGTSILTVDSTSQVTLQFTLPFSAASMVNNTGLTISFGTNVNNLYPYRFFYSSAAVAGGTITWTPAADFKDVDFSEEITGAGTVSDTLIIFTAFSAYTYDQSDYKQQNWPGCLNHRSIQSTESFLIYANGDGIWVTGGTKPVCVSNDVTQLIRNSDSSKWSSAVTDRVYSLFLGTTSADGVTYSNCVLNYDIPSGMFWWREFRGANMTNTILCAIKRSGQEYLTIGDTAGNVFVKSRYQDASPVFTDNGVEIYSQFRTKAYDLGSPEVMKMISQVLFYCERGSGLKAYFRVIDTEQKVLADWTLLTSLSNAITSVEKSLQGHFLEFKFEDYSKNPYFRFYGLSVLLAQSTKTD